MDAKVVLVCACNTSKASTLTSTVSTFKLILAVFVAIVSNLVPNLLNA